VNGEMIGCHSECELYQPYFVCDSFRHCLLVLVMRTLELGRSILVRHPALEGDPAYSFHVCESML
jgi:hypothetical protein